MMKKKKKDLHSLLLFVKRNYVYICRGGLSALNCDGLVLILLLFLLKKTLVLLFLLISLFVQL